MKEINIDKKPVIAGVTWKEENTEHIVIYIDETKKRILSRAESKIWRLINGKRSIREIISKIGKENESNAHEILSLFYDAGLIKYKTNSIWLEED